jgi:hypothetical protein
MMITAIRFEHPRFLRGLTVNEPNDHPSVWKWWETHWISSGDERTAHCSHVSSRESIRHSPVEVNSGPTIRRCPERFRWDWKYRGEQISGVGHWQYRFGSYDLLARTLSRNERLHIDRNQ